MKFFLLGKLKIIPIFTLILFVQSLSFTAGTIYAANPVPQNRLPCNQEQDPNFHSLRPYQAAPCGDSPKAYYCAPSIIIYESGPAGSEKQEGLYPANIDVREKTYSVQISEVELPIYGNTEQVKNYKNDSDEYDDATKLNEYVSWYLSGVNGKAEYAEVSNDQIINFSGPVKKLLPSAIQEAQRLLTIKSASKPEDQLETFSSDKSSSPTNKQTYDSADSGDPSQPANHNQVVVCEKGGKAVPCPNGNELKLKDWGQGDLSIFNKILNWIPGFDVWNKRYPPLPWQFKTDLEYKKAYNEWRGKQCLILPIFGLTCLDVPGITSNKWADLYQYVPLTNNSDKNAKFPIEGVQIEGKGGTEIEISDPKYKILKEPVGMFAHTQEDSQNLDLLRNTYLPKTCEGENCKKITPEIDYSTVETGREEQSNQCRVINVRSNEGDNLFMKVNPSLISVLVSPYKVTQKVCDEPIIANCTKNKEDCKRAGQIIGYRCHWTVQISINNGSKHPFADEVWKSSVADSASVFRKIYPKVGEGSPVSCIADVPGVSKAVYTPLDNTPKDFEVQGFGQKFDPQDARIYFPHIGGVYDYFLKGIQTALRPLGFADPTPASGQYCSGVKCGELPNLPSASGSCKLGSVSSRIGNIPQSLKQIIEAAAQTYKVPPNLIIGVMYGEGLFNPGRFNWTDQNVKNWATCQKVPGCNDGGGDDNFMGFIGNDWSNITPKIRNDLLKLDPNRKEPNQCNLLDAVYGLAWNLHDSADGGGGLPATCFGIPLNSTIPQSCSWNDNQYESAIKIHESGYTSACLTKENSCATGSGLDAACPNGDTCETRSHRYSNPSHNACVWDVSHSQ